MLRLINFKYNPGDVEVPNFLLVVGDLKEIENLCINSFEAVFQSTFSSAPPLTPDHYFPTPRHTLSNDLLSLSTLHNKLRTKTNGS